MLKKTINTNGLLGYSKRHLYSSHNSAWQTDNNKRIWNWYFGHEQSTCFSFPFTTVWSHEILTADCNCHRELTVSLRLVFQKEKTSHFSWPVKTLLMNINRDPIAPPGVISPPFKQIDPYQSQKGINFQTILAEIILLEVQKEGTPWAPLTLLLRQDFPSKGKHNRVIIEKPITFLSTYPNWMIKLEKD